MQKKQQGPFVDDYAVDMVHVRNVLPYIKEILQLGASVNHIFSTCQSLLSIACWKNDVEAVRLLLSKGANPNFAISHSELPIFSASSLEVAKMLVEAGAKVNVKGHLGQTPLHIACLRSSVELATFYIEQGAPVEEPNNFGQTAMHYSSTKLVPMPNDKSELNFQSGTPRTLSLPLIKLLLAHGANLKTPDDKGYTPKNYSEMNGCDMEIEKCLLGIEYYPHELFQKLRDGDTKTVIEWLNSELNNPNIEDRCETLAHLAATLGQRDVLAKLIERKAWIDRQLKPEAFSDDWMYGRTPLFSACERACYPEIIDTIAMLIKEGANVNLLCKDNLTPFLQLCVFGYKPAIRTMIRHAYESLVSGNVLPTQPISRRQRFQHAQPKTTAELGEIALKKLCEMYIDDETEVKANIAQHNAMSSRYLTAQKNRNEAFRLFSQDPTADNTLTTLQMNADICKKSREDMQNSGDFVTKLIDYHSSEEYKVSHSRLGKLIERFASLITPSQEILKLAESNQALKYIFKQATEKTASQ